MTFRSIGVLTLALMLVGCHRSPKYYTGKAEKLFAAGKYADAEINYRKAIQANSAYGEAYAGLGQTDLKLGRGREAYAAFSRAVELLPTRDDLKVTLGELILTGYLTDKRRPKALYDQLNTLSDQLMARSPYDGLRFKAYLAASENRPELALELFEKANSAKPMQPSLILGWTQVLFQSKQPEKGEKLALDLINADKTYVPIYDLLYRRYLATKRLADAEKLLETRVGNNPKDPAAILQLAVFYYGAGRREQMTATLQRLIDRKQEFPDAHMQVGDFYSKLQDWDAAIREYDLGAADAKDDSKREITYLKRITNVYLTQGKGEQATAVLHRILTQQPADEEARGVNASLLLKSGTPENLNAALAEFQNLVNKSPDNAIWHYNLGRTHAAKRNTDAAWTEFQEAIKRSNDYVPPRLALAEISQTRNKYADTVRYADEVLASRPNLPAAMLLRVAGLTGMGKYSEARPALEQLEKAFPQNRDVQFQAGSLELAQKKYADAEARFRKLFEQDRRDPRALSALVQTYVAEDQLVTAYRLLLDELGKSPNFEAARSLLADVAIRLSKYDVAVTQYRELLISHPSSAALHLQLGSAYRQNGDLANAISSLEAAIKLAPRDIASRGLLASALEESGRKGEAIAAYRGMLQVDPENAAAMNNLAYLIAETGGSLDEALNLAQRVVQKAPQQANFADTLGWIYFKKGMLDAAIQVFRNDVQKFPEKATFRYHLGLALVRAGDKQSGKTELLAALSKAPSPEVNQSIKETLASLQ